MKQKNNNLNSQKFVSINILCEYNSDCENTVGTLQ